MFLTLSPQSPPEIQLNQRRNKGRSSQGHFHPVGTESDTQELQLCFFSSDREMQRDFKQWFSLDREEPELS